MSKATETRRPNGFRISCNVSSVGLPCFERIAGGANQGVPVFASRGKEKPKGADQPPFRLGKVQAEDLKKSHSSSFCCPNPM